MTRRARGVVTLVLAATLAAPLLFALTSEGRLACDEPYLTERQPGGSWTLAVCGRPRLFAMPGGGSDAPGWIVLRDGEGAIRGVSALAMLQLYATTGAQTEWTDGQVSRSMVFDLPLDPARGRFDRWWDERMWRLRAILGVTPDDEDHR